MANPNHLAILQEALAKKDIRIWNDWRYQQVKADAYFKPDLRVATLRGANLAYATLLMTTFLNVDLSAILFR